MAWVNDIHDTYDNFRLHIYHQPSQKLTMTTEKQKVDKKFSSDKPFK